MNKIIYKKLYILIRICVVILFFLQILSLDFNYTSKASIFIKVIFLIILWNIPNTISYKSIKKFISSYENTVLNFYKDYLKEEAENRCIIIYYNKIEKIYKLNNEIILKTKDPIKYIMIRGENFTDESVLNIADFLQNVIDKNLESNELSFKKVLMENEANL